MFTYQENMAAYQVGCLTNMEPWNAFTLTKEGAGDLAFGVPVMPGTAGGTCIELDATNGRNVLGITRAMPTLPHTGDAYRQYDNVAVFEYGVIGVKLGANVTRGAQARWDTVNKVWTAAAQSATVVTIPGAQFDEAGTSGAVGALRYRRPVPSASVAGA